MQTVFAQLYYSGFSEYVNSFSEIRKCGAAFLCIVSDSALFRDAAANAVICFRRLRLTERVCRRVRRMCLHRRVILEYLHFLRRV